MSTTGLPGARRPAVRAEVVGTPTPQAAGTDVEFRLRVTNLTSVIQGFEVTVLGVDPARIASPAVVDLFPDEGEEVVVRLRVPRDHAAGSHTVSIRVGPPDDERAAVVDATFEVLPEPGLLMLAEPATVETGATGTFLLHLHNTGNTVLRPVLTAQDPERLVDVTVEPEEVELAGGERAVLQVTATAPRPWFGMPVVRVLDLGAEDGDAVAIGALALVQRARISRRLVAFLGLLAMISVFALVITLSFGRVADLTARNEALVRQGLGFDGAGDGRAAPGTVSGTIAAATSGGLDGASVELYEQANPLQPMLTTVTGPDGSYTFTGVPAGSYLVRTEVAGFDPMWHPGVLDLADADVVEVTEDAATEGLVATLVGRPGGITGQVLGVDVAEAVLQVRLPAGTIISADPQLADAASLLQEISLDELGRFEIGNLDTPGTYEVLVTKPGFADVSQTVTLRAGEVRDDVELLLARGIGVILGTVVDPSGQPIGGVDVLATDGAGEFTTRTLSDDTAPGTFELRDLDASGTYTLTFSRPGYVTETRTVQTVGDETPPLTVPMAADTASISGAVVDVNGARVPSATVTISGVDVERTTRSLSIGDAGSWRVDDLPKASTYTVRASSPGYVTTAVSVELTAGAGADRTGVVLTLVPAPASIEGEVADAAGTPVAGATVTLEGTDLTRITYSADDPVGAFRLDRLPAGVYTVTFDRSGSEPQTRLVDLSPGETLRLGQVRLEPQALVRGIVRRDGAAASDIEVIAYRSEDYPSNPVATRVTGIDGAFSFLGLDAPQRYVLEFRSAGGEVLHSETVDLSPGELVELVVDL